MGRLLLAFLAFTIVQTFAVIQTFTPIFQDGGIGGSGYVTDILIYPDANLTQIVRTDTNGHYVRTGSGAWSPLFTPISLPGADISSVGNIAYNTLQGNAPLNSGGFAAAACAYPTQSATSLTGSVSIIYGVWNGNIYKSTNGGVNFTNVYSGAALATVNGNNSTQKAQSNYLFCDPQSSGQVAYVATPSAAPLATCNSTSWASVSGITAPTANTGTLIAGDPTSTVSAGITQHLFISSAGAGVYESYSGGACGGSFTLVTGSPTALIAMWVDKFGVLWAIAPGEIYKYVANGTAGGGTWTSVHAFSQNGSLCAPTGFQGLAIDPSASSEATETIVLVCFSGQTDISSDGGSTWSNYQLTQTLTFTSPDIPWLANADQGGYINTGKAAFDVSSNLFSTGGIGIWKMSAPVSTSNKAYVSNTKGIEQLVVTRVISPPGVYPTVSGWDKGCYGAVNPDVFPSSQYSNAVGISGGWDQDWDAFALGHTVCLNNSNIGSGEFTGYSTTGGNSFTTLSAFPNGTTQIGGMIAFNNGQYVDVPGQGQVPYCSTTLVGSWTAISFPGSPASHWLNNYYLGRHVLAADRVSSGVFYAYDGGGVGLFSSSGGCNGTWTQVFSGYIDGSAVFAGFDEILQAVPNVAGELYFTSGPVGGTQPTSNSFMRSTNGGAAWTAISLVQEVFGFGFGAPKPGSSTPFTLYFWGTYNGTPGLYYTTDDFATAPIFVSSYIGASTVASTIPTGDNNVPGRIYTPVSNSGGGQSYIDLSWACPAVAFSNIKPGDNVTGTITLQATRSGNVPVKDVQFFVDGVLIGTQTSGSGSPVVYSQSWNTSGVAVGNHILSVATEDNAGNGCTVNPFNGTISGTSGTVNSGTPPTVGQQLAFPGLSGAPPVVKTISGASFTIAGQSQTLTGIAMAASNAMFSIPIATH